MWSTNWNRSTSRYICLALTVFSGICPAQIPQSSDSHYLEIRLPGEVNSETVFIRYILDGDDLGGWVQPVPGVSSYLIATTRMRRPATRIKALIYAAGCAIRTLDLPVSGLTNQHYAFVCQPLPNIMITGVVNRSDRFYGHEVLLHANYLARWAQPFMKPADVIVTTIPVGNGSTLSTEGRFRLLIPDLTQDPLAGAPDHPGELQIRAADKMSGDIIAELILDGAPAIKTRMGGLKIQSQYPPAMVFEPCASNPRILHNATGFALRPKPDDPCNR